MLYRNAYMILTLLTLCIQTQYRMAISKILSIVQEVSRSKLKHWIHILCCSTSAGVFLIKNQNIVSLTSIDLHTQTLLICREIWTLLLNAGNESTTKLIPYATKSWAHWVMIFSARNLGKWVQLVWYTC